MQIVTYKGQRYEVLLPDWYLKDILAAEYGTSEEQVAARSEMKAFDAETEAIIQAQIDAGWEK